MALDGEVSSYESKHGWGFIKGSDGKDYFLHKNNLAENAVGTIVPGQRVRFEIGPAFGSGKHPQALQVTSSHSLPAPVEDNDETIVVAEPRVEIVPVASDAPQEQPIEASRLLPAQAFDLLPAREPRRFVGREQVLKRLTTSIAGFNNSFVTGEIGIGKSSVLQQAIQLLNGDSHATSRHGFTVQGARGPIAATYCSCNAATKLPDIRGLLINNLKTHYVHAGVRGWSRSILSWAARVASFQWGGTLRTEAPLATPEATDAELLQAIREFVKQETWVARARDAATSDAQPIAPAAYTGLVLIIDDLEKIDHAAVPIAEWAKNIRDQLGNERIGNIAFVLCGAGDVRSKILSHNDAIRYLFPDSIEVPPLPEADMRQLLRQRLAEAGKTITPDMEELFLALAGGNPRSLFYLGNTCGSQDSDGIIDRNDCLEKAREYADQLSSAGIGIAAEREALQATLMAVANAAPFEVSATDIMKARRLEGEENLRKVRANCGVLVKQNIFLSREGPATTDGSKKRYRFNDPVLALWIRMLANLTR